MYFADLSEYQYLPDRSRPPGVVLNVGWLAAGHPFPIGECPADFLARLRELAGTPVALTRGFHRCEFCAGPVRDERTPRGNGEIRVRGAGGVIYAAPVLIAHYVEAHGYRPPDEFITAVLDAAPSSATAGHSGAFALSTPVEPMQPVDRAARVVLNYAGGHLPARWRTTLGFVLALGGGFGAGYALSFAGFGFFPAWVCFTFALPLVVCLVAESRHVLVALLSVAAMMGFLLFRAFLPGEGAFAGQLRPNQQRGVLVVTLVLTGISLVIAGGIGAAFAARRRARVIVGGTEMTDAWSQLAGVIESTLNPDQFARALASQRLRSQVRESSHYVGGRYVRVYDGADFTLERVGDDEYLASGDAASLEQMKQTASCVSQALTALDIRHSFEVYDGDSQLVHYLHHRWPQ